MPNQIGSPSNSAVTIQNSRDLKQNTAESSLHPKNNPTSCIQRTHTYYCPRPLWSLQPFSHTDLPHLEISSHDDANEEVTTKVLPRTLSSLPLELFEQIARNASLEDQVNLSESNKQIHWLSRSAIQKLKSTAASINAISSLPEDTRIAHFDHILKDSSQLSPAMCGSILQALSKRLEALPHTQRHERLYRLDSQARKLPEHEKSSVLGYLFIADILLSEDENSLSHTINEQIFARSISVVPLKDAITKRLQHLSDAQQERVLIKALTNGYPDVVRSFEIILKDPRVSMSRKRHLLTANQAIESRNEGAGAGAFGWRDILAGYMLLTMPFVSIDDNDLTEEASPVLVPSLHFSLARGHAETTLAFAEIVKIAKLSENNIVKLLSANDANGTPGLHMACKRTNAEYIIKAFGQAIQNTDLSAASKTKLLAAKNSYGIPAIHWAWKSENKAAISAYAEIILSSELPAKNIRELLAANTPLLGRIAHALTNQLNLND